MHVRDNEKVVGRILPCVRQVAERLGPGLELKEYEAALDRSMRESKLQFARQYPIGVPFDGPPDRGFHADFIVGGWVLLELQRVAELTAEQNDLALNYLRESGCDLCLLINFGKSRAEVRRILPSGDWRIEVG